MNLQSMTRVAILVAALAGPAMAAPTAIAAGDTHRCPAGFESKRAETGEERAKDRNDDGMVCVRESDGEIRDDVH